MRIKTFGFSLALVAAIFAPSHAIAQSPTILWTGHADQDRINSVIFNPSGDTLISGSSGRPIHFWRVSDGQLLRTLNTNAPSVHESAIEWLAITRDATRLASCSYKIVKLWTLPQGTEKTLTGHNDWVVCVAFSPNGQLLASASFDGTVRIWKASDGTFLHSISNPRQMRCVAFSPDGSLLAGGGGDADVHIWRTSDWTETKTLHGHTSDIYTLTFSPDGTRLASGGYDQTVRVWNPSTGAHLYTLSGNNGNVYGISFNANGTQLAYTDGEGDTIRIHRVSDGARLQLYTQQVNDVQTVAFSPSGLLGYGRIDQRVILASVTTSNPPPQTTWSLTEAVSGNGSIQVSPAPNAANGTYANGTVVTLTAVPSGTNQFIKWTGAVSGNAMQATVTMNNNKSVAAAFTTTVSEEIVWQNQNQSLAAWRMDGLAYKGSVAFPAANPGWRLVGIGDFTADSQKDLLLQSGNGQLVVWKMNGDTRVARFAIRPNYHLPPDRFVAGVGDLTQDGNPDILLMHRNSSVSLWVMDKTSLVRTQWLRNGLPVGGAWRVVGLGDIDGDGQTDIIYFNVNTRQVMAWLMDGTAFVKGVQLHNGAPATPGWTAVDVGDFNNDGKTDVLWHNDNNGQLAVWFFNGLTYTGATTLRSGYATSTSWNIIKAR